jgi:hypothetical protein
MLNTVHGHSLRVCQWTGESLFYVPFKIPVKGLKEFRGCYGSPSVAISAIIDTCEKAGLASEEVHEMIDVFQASLIRKSGKEAEKFTIMPAPNYKLLRIWGGHNSLEEYHKSYDHDRQIELFDQIIPKVLLMATVQTDTREEEETKENESEDFKDMEGPRAEAAPKDPKEPGSSTDPPVKRVDFEYDSDPDRAPNAPKRWRYNFYNAHPHVSEPVEGRQVMPRCISSCLEFFKEVIPGESAVIVYLDPGSDKSFAVGKPQDWMTTANKRASDALGKTQVYGHVTLFHKNKLRVRAKRVREEAEKK